MKKRLKAFFQDAARKIAGFAGSDGSSRGPIVVVIGARTPAEIIFFLDAVLKKIPEIGDHIRSVNRGVEVIRYLNNDPHPDPIFYRDNNGEPSARVQELIAERSTDPKRRDFLPPLFLVAVTHYPSPHPKPEIPSHALTRVFAECVGARIVDITATAEQTALDGCAPLPYRLKNLFLTMVSRKGGPATEPEAEALIEDALKNLATTSDDTVIKLAAACRDQASMLGMKRVTRDFLWEIFPQRFREAVQPSAAILQ